MARSTRWLDGLIKGIEAITATIMIGITVIIFLEVLSRYVLNFPFVFSGELTSLLFPWVIFLGAIVVTKDEGHLAISYFREKFPIYIQKWLNIFSKLVMLFFSFYMFRSNILLTESVSRQTFPIMGISLKWLYIAGTIAFLCMTLLLIHQIILLLLNKQPESN